MTNVYESSLGHFGNEILGIISETEKLLNGAINMESRSFRKRPKITVFDQFEGGISISGFIEEVVEVFEIEHSTVILSVILIFKLNKRIRLTYNNIFIIMYIAMIVSSKMQQDTSLNEEELCLFIGISRSQLSVLEFHFLETLDYNVLVNDLVYDQYRKIICENL